MVPRLLAVLLVFAAAMHASADCILPNWTAVSEIARAANGVRAIDLNGDGRPDLAGYSASGVFVALNDGNGAFPAATDVYTGTVIGPLVTGELTGDTAVDLAFGTTNAIVVLPGYGNGTFGPALTTAVTLTTTNIAAATLDAGPSLDLLVYDAVLAVMVRFLNDGTGHFTEGSRRVIQPKAAAFVVADLDGDTQTDAVVAYDTEYFDGFFAAADGTFGDPQVIRATSPARVLRTADMDGSGLPDVVLGTTFGRVATLRNLGSRNFSDPIGYWDDSTLLDLEPTDLTGDGHRDVITISTRCSFRFWKGTGLGTLQYGWWHALDSTNIYDCVQYSTADLDAADFDGDGRTDLVIATQTNASKRVRTFRNRCGDGTVKASAVAPVITAGTDAVLEVTIESIESEPYVYSYGGTGTITITQNDATVATGTLVSGDARIPISGLSIGTHTFVAAHEGDAQYEPNQSDPVTVRVTADTTTTTVNASPSRTEYLEVPVITATVTASNGQAIAGTFRLKIDGREVPFERSGATATVSPDHIPSTVGTHTVLAEFLGDDVQPPSSATAIYEIVKKTPALSMSRSWAVAGETTSVRLSVNAGIGYYDAPMGTVTLAVAGQSLGSKTLQSWPPADFTLPALPAGRYALSATYSGDDRYNAVETLLPLIVFPSTGTFADARGTAEAVTVTWRSGYTRVRRRAAGEAWPGSGGTCCAFAPPWLDDAAQPETVYLYRVEDINTGSVSEADVGMRISFTDDPAMAGTAIKALHLQEIVRAANFLRTAANLSQISAAPFAAGSAVSAAPLVALRAAINEARVALGAFVYPFTATIEAGAPVRAADIQELREAIR